MSKFKKTALLSPKLFPATTFVLKGKFDGYPDQDDIVSFLEGQGGKVARTIDSSTDVLILGKGSVTAAKQAAKLNAAGKAEIQTVKSVWDLLEFADRDGAFNILANPKSLKIALGYPRWIWQGLDFEGQDFSKQKIGVAGSANFAHLDQSSFDGSSFDKAVVSNVGFPGDEADYASTSFKQTTFKNVTFFGNSSLTLSRVSARNLTTLFCESTTIESSELVKWKSTAAVAGKFSKLKIRGFSSAEHFDFEKCVFRDCQISAVDLSEFSFNKCRFQNCRFEKGSIKKVKFDQCFLDSVTFSNLKFYENDFQKSKLRSVKFVSVDLRSTNWSNSGKVDVVLKDCKQSGLCVTTKQATGFRGLNANTRIDPLSSKSFKLISKAITESQEIEASIVATSGKTSMKFAIEKCGFDTAFVITKNGKENRLQTRKGYSSPENLIDIQRGLNWLAATARKSKPKMETIKAKTTKSSLKGKALTTVLAEVWTEIFDASPQPNQDVVAKINLKALSGRKLKAKVIESLKSGNVSDINAVAEQLSELEKFRNLSVPNSKLAKVKLKGIQLNGSDFSGCDLRGASFDGSDCQRVNFSDCDLRDVNFENTDLRKVNFENADLRGVKFDENTIWGTNLKNANLSKASIKGGYVSGVDFSEANIRGMVFDGATYCPKTVFPKHVTQKQIKSLRKGWSWGDK